MNAKLTAKELIVIYQSVRTKQDFIEKAILVMGMNAEKVELAYHCIDECHGILEVPEEDFGGNNVS